GTGAGAGRNHPAQQHECCAREAEFRVDCPATVTGWIRDCPTHSAQLSDSSSRHSSRAENSAKRVRTSWAVHSRKIHAEERRTSPATKWTRPAVIGPSWRVSRYTDQVVPPRARSPMCAALLRSMVSGGVVIVSAAGRFSTVAPEAPPRQTVAGTLSAYIAREVTEHTRRRRVRAGRHILPQLRSRRVGKFLRQLRCPARGAQLRQLLHRAPARDPKS